MYLNIHVMIIRTHFSILMSLLSVFEFSKKRYTNKTYFKMIIMYCYYSYFYSYCYYHQAINWAVLCFLLLLTALWNWMCSQITDSFDSCCPWSLSLMLLLKHY